MTLTSTPSKIKAYLCPQPLWQDATGECRRFGHTRQRIRTMTPNLGGRTTNGASPTEEFNKQIRPSFLLLQNTSSPATVHKAAGAGKERRKARRRRRRREKRKKKSKEEKADVLEPEKCPLPREVGPFFPLLTGGENIYKTNREHISCWSGAAADSKLHFCDVPAASGELAALTPASALASFFFLFWKNLCGHGCLG